MAIDWVTIATRVNGFDENGKERILGTRGGRRALEILLGEQNLRDAVDYFIDLRPGCLTAEMVLKILKPVAAMQRCHEIFKTERDRDRAASAVFVLAFCADADVLPWVLEFLQDEHKIVRLNGLMVLRNVLYGPVGDDGIVTAKEILQRAEQDPDADIQKLANEIRRQLSRYERREHF